LKLFIGYVTVLDPVSLLWCPAIDFCFYGSACNTGGLGNDIKWLCLIISSRNLYVKLSK